MNLTTKRLCVSHPLSHNVNLKLAFVAAPVVVTDMREPPISLLDIIYKVTMRLSHVNMLDHSYILKRLIELFW
jgi:hypothetical protein